MDNNDIKPSTIMLIAGGAVLLISTFLDWRGGDIFRDFNGWETDAIGFLGIFVALIGIAVAGSVAAQQFGNVALPDNILGFTFNQLVLVLGFSAFLITFGQIIAEGVAIGIHLGWLSSGVIVAGAIMEQRSGDAAASPPTQF